MTFRTRETNPTALVGVAYITAVALLSGMVEGDLLSRALDKLTDFLFQARLVF